MYISVWLRPDRKVSGEVSEIIRRSSERYHTYRNLNEWKGPHVTFYTLKIRPRRYALTMRELASICGKHRRFRVKVDGTGYFMKRVSKDRRNYVVYFRIAGNAALLRLWKDADRLMGRHKASHRPFTPHMTIAYDDLDRENFYLALREFRGLEFKRGFEVQELMASTRLRGKRIVRTLRLGEDPPNR